MFATAGNKKIQIPLLKTEQAEEFRQRKIRKCKSRCRKSGKKNVCNSGKLKNANLAVENQVGSRLFDSGKSKNVNLVVMKWDFADASIRNLESVQSRCSV